MRKCITMLVAVLVAGLAMLVLATAVLARPQSVGISGVEPDTLSSELGGTLSIYGSGFTTQTLARLRGYNVLATTFVNDSLIQATVPARAPAGIYDLVVSASGAFTSAAGDMAELPAALTIVAATPIPTSPPAPTPKPAPPPGRPVLAIRNYSVEPSRVVVGREFVVTIEIYNTGSRAGENTIVTFPGGTFLPVGETGHLLGQLHINHSAVVTQRMRAPAGMASGSYNLRVNLSANDWEGSHFEYPETVGVEVIGVGHGRPRLVIDAARTRPAILGPGDAFSLTLELANRGNRTATGLLLGVAAPDMAAPASGSNVVAVEPLGVNRTAVVTLSLVLGQVAEAGRLNLDVVLDYADYQGGAYSDRQSVGLEVSTALEDRPQLLLESYEIAPDSLTPGEPFTLTLVLSNVGGGDAQRVTLTLGGDGGRDLGPFAPVTSGNVRFVARLGAGDTVTVVQKLIVDGSAEPGAYSLPISLAYDDARRTRHVDEQRISLLIRRRPHLHISFFRPVYGAIVGESFDLPIDVTNIGRTLVNVSTVEIVSEDLEIHDGSMYFGPLDGGTTGSLEASAVAQEGGTAELVVLVHYLDDFEQAQTITQTLTVDVEAPLVDETPVEGTVEESAEESEGGFWDKVLNLLRGLLGLGS
ncbi:MAG TPA: hypothetical protein ENN19_17830 [Chloroflexi bacterium]|nr:hypothetical protein [Chloroflexota bacterium]